MHSSDVRNAGVEYATSELFFRVSESDLIPGLGTFIACLVVQLEIGILCGVGLNIIFILYHAARPKISVEKLTVIIHLLSDLKEFLQIFRIAIANFRNSKL